MGSGVPGLGTLVLWFIVVIALIPVALWLLKRTPIGGGVGGRSGLPKTVAVLPLSSHHKVVTIEVGQGKERQWLVVGVSPQGLRTLHQMTPSGDVDPTAPAPPGAAFAQLLGRLRHDRGDRAA